LINQECCVITLHHTEGNIKPKQASRSILAFPGKIVLVHHSQNETIEAIATSPGPVLKNALPTRDLAFGIIPTVDITPDKTLLAKLSVALVMPLTLQVPHSTSENVQFP
jgi:hypothetical protein